MGSKSRDPNEQFEQQRRWMVQHDLRGRGIVDERVLDAMLSVPREEFVLEELRDEAYEDRALPIGYRQTISQPFTVAYMLQALQLKGEEKVLEVGTGSGYGAAVLSQLVRQVYTVERIPELTKRATHSLAQLGYDNVHVGQADGIIGWPAEAPFDAIVVTAGAERLPQQLWDQLADDGRIVIPIGDAIGQTLVRFRRDGDRERHENLGAFAFVPLIVDE
jgi:protein-L-isoaspartate(D-aspartate) O-methyltransferase